MKILGYKLPEKKVKALMWKDFIKLAGNNGFKLIEIDITKDIETQGPFDAIIHKVDPIETDEDAIERPNDMKFINFLKSHPEIIVFNPIDKVSVLNRRNQLNEELQTLHFPPELNTRIPKFIQVTSEDPEEVRNSLKGIKFPVLAKPGNQCLSHELLFTTDIEGLLNFPVPYIVQEYQNHGGVIFKGYALGDELIIDIRPSTRDIAKNEELTLLFDSHSPPGSNALWTEQRDLKGVPFDIERGRKVSEIIRSHFQCQVIGIDFLVDENGAFWIIDLNNFPGYTNVPNLPGLFLNFFKKYV